MNWLGQLATTLRSVKGRKQIVYLSEGFDARMVQGRDVREKDDALSENDAVMSGKLYNVDSDMRFGSGQQLNNLARMERAFHGSDVVLNALDIRGIRGGNEESGTGDAFALAQANDGLFLLSRTTGGVVLQNSNDVGSDFARLLHRQEVVYILGFQAPPGTKPNAFHPLQVKVTGTPRGTQVTHRTGYYDSMSEDVNERLLSTADIITHDIPQHDVGVSTLAAAFPTSNGNFQVPVIVDIDGDQLLRAAKADRGSAEIFVYAFAEDGSVRDRLYQNVLLDLKKVGDRARSGGVRYYGTLTLPPGRYAVKALVRGADDRKGFSRTDVIVPKSGDLAMMPVPIDEHPKAVLIKGTTTEAYPFKVSGEPFVPCTAAQSKVALYVSGANAEDISVENGAKVLQKMNGMLLLDMPHGAELLVSNKGATQKVTVK